MNKLFATTLTILASLLLPNVAEAAIINGSFEDGFDSWQTLGDFSIETSSFGSGPVEGNFQAFLSTAFNEVVRVDANGVVTIGGNAAPATFITGVAENSLDSFLGVSSFFGEDFLADAIEGSAIQQTFTAKAEDTLSFAWNFLTNEGVGDNSDPAFNDFAFAILNNGSENLFFQLADTTSEFLASGSTNQDFFEETGFRTFSFTLPTEGEYTLGIGVVDVGESTVLSGLLLDRVQVNEAQDVPETSSIASLLFFGTVGAITVLKRKQKRLMVLPR